MFEKLISFNSRLSYVIMWLSAAGLVAMTLIVGWQVFARYVLNASPSWSEQASLILMIWYAILAAAAGFHEGFHIRILAGQNAVPANVARIMRIMIEILVIIGGLMMLIWGLQLVNIISSHVVPSLGISRAWAYLPLPIAGLLIILFSGTRLVGEIIYPGWTLEEQIDTKASDVGGN